MARWPASCVFSPTTTVGSRRRCATSELLIRQTCSAFSISLVARSWSVPAGTCSVACTTNSVKNDLAVDPVERALDVASSYVQSSFEARATARKLSRKQSATAAHSSVSGDQRSPGPSNSAGGADAIGGRPAAIERHVAGRLGAGLDGVTVRIRMHGEPRRRKSRAKRALNRAAALAVHRAGAQRAHARWYGRPLIRLTARYSASATTTRARPCGSVRADSDQRSRARASMSGASPSGPPMQKTGASPSRARASSQRASSCSGQGLAADLQRDDVRAIAGRGEHALAFGFDGAAHVAAATFAQRDLGQFEPVIAAQAAGVVLEPCIDPGRHARAGGKQAHAHARRSRCGSARAGRALRRARPPRVSRARRTRGRGAASRAARRR